MDSHGEIASMSSLPERDWKVFAKILPVAHERFCQRALDEVNKISAETSKDTCDRFLRVAKLVRDREKELRTTLSDYRRSTAWIQITALYSRGLLTEGEFTQFSDQTRNSILEWQRVSRA
jgi:hypothetical protein